MLLTFIKDLNSYLINNYKYKPLNFELSKNDSSWLNNDYNIKRGIDMRFSNITDTDTKSLMILQENLKKIVLLSKLENNNISIPKKIILIEESGFIEKSSYVTTLYAAGLMDDFNNQI